jgi:hypothetical protein
MRLRGGERDLQSESLGDDTHSKMVDDASARDGDGEEKRRGKADVDRGSSILEQTDLETEEETHQTREEDDLDHTLTVVDEDERQGAGEGEGEAAGGGAEEPSAEEDDRTEGDAPFCNGVSRRKGQTNMTAYTHAHAHIPRVPAVCLAYLRAWTH